MRPLVLRYSMKIFFRLVFAVKNALKIVARGRVSSLFLIKTPAMNLFSLVLLSFVVVCVQARCNWTDHIHWRGNLYTVCGAYSIYSRMQLDFKRNATEITARDGWVTTYKSGAPLAKVTASGDKVHMCDRNATFVLISDP
jgi:hypothetical protein